MTAFIVLLRAVNVGGTGKVPMAELRTACENAGLRNVSTYIASGNLICSSAESEDTVRDLVAGVLRDRFGMPKNQPIVRSNQELADVIKRNPFADAAAERPNLLQIHFLDGAARVGALDGIKGRERLHLDGRHLYVDYVDGIGRSKLTPSVLERALLLASTARNWNTAQRIFDISQSIR